eukprot:scaffold855_cov274-Chaetoceros_neogracile.AAC.6
MDDPQGLIFQVGMQGCCCSTQVLLYTIDCCSFWQEKYHHRILRIKNNQPSARRVQVAIDSETSRGSFSIAATTEVLREAKYKSETSSVDDHRGSIFQFRSRGAKTTFADEIDGTNNRTSQ